MAIKRISDFDEAKKQSLWSFFQGQPELKNFLLELFQEAIEKEDSLAGVTPDKLQHKQGVIAGLQKGLGIINRTQEKISNE